VSHPRPDLEASAAPLYLYDDALARRFEPFALTRPVGELRAGTEIIRRRWELLLGRGAAGAIAAEHLVDFDEDGAAPVLVDSLAPASLRAGAIVANSRCVVKLGINATREADVWMCEGRVAAVRLGRETPLSELSHGELRLESLSAAGSRTADVAGVWVDSVWELITGLADQLRSDIACTGPALDCALPAGAIVLAGSEAIYVERGARVEPMVCFDVSAGPVLVRSGAVVRAFTRLVGPVAVASGASILGDRVDSCSIGEASMVHGEISNTVVLGHSNKSHDGFVGHSYLGRWVNLGAGTITSNLKNTYGVVQLWTPDGLSDTGAIKLGSFIGDHVKTGIGTRLTTGSLIGAGSNLYGGPMPPKYVPPFSWGEGDDLAMYRLDKFLENAARAMLRRGVTLSEREKRQLAAAHALCLEARA
jgi:UDP-N-acetylglucosamine diphosphorylase / glucose-1-phosphate thymidylyltransferase / UDP-N-acetylgalactosamine diphosphorylase / glucosamine-1-phosphate N-acetyltransferase / galactosamine-1-phosphate N-acetyltransferase